MEDAQATAPVELMKTALARPNNPEKPGPSSLKYLFARIGEAISSKSLINGLDAVLHLSFWPCKLPGS
jgi:hypothetical protein